MSRILEGRVRELGMSVEILDGDVVHTSLTAGLGFSKQDRDASIRRVGWVCELAARSDRRRDQPAPKSA